MLLSVASLVLALHVSAEVPVVVGLIDDYRGVRCLNVAFFKGTNEWHPSNGLEEAFPVGRMTGAWPESRDNPLRSDTHEEFSWPELPKQVLWTVAFDGRKIGQFTTAGDCASVRQQCSIDAPSVGKPEEDFGSWSKPMALRPLIALSRPHYRDPEGWKLKALDAQEQKAVLAQFRADRTHMVHCPDRWGTKPEPFDPARARVAIYNSYISSKGDRLIVLKPDATQHHCDGSPDEWSESVYYVPAGKVPRLLGAVLYPVDAGDYDADGKSEFIFYMRHYNEDGYVLFSNNFERAVKFSWSYH